MSKLVIMNYRVDLSISLRLLALAPKILAMALHVCLYIQSVQTFAISRVQGESTCFYSLNECTEGIMNV